MTEVFFIHMRELIIEKFKIGPVFIIPPLDGPNNTFR